MQKLTIQDLRNIRGGVADKKKGIQKKRGAGKKKASKKKKKAIKKK